MKTLFISTNDNLITIGLLENNKTVERIYINNKMIRESRNLSQDQVADEMHKTQSSYARIERGATKIDLETLCLFADVMGMSLIDVITFPTKITLEDRETNIEAILQLRLTKAKKDEVLKIVFGEENLELLK
jgi:transcriptional regulator with XRE-family HTH domain